MGMKNTKAIKKDIARRTRPSDAELGTINANNGDAGAIISGLTAGNKTIDYETKDIALADIRVNPDNEIFNAADTEEDIVTLAEDIQRNGLMHNLVVFPQDENGKTVYMLLSGERRFKAMQYLERKGDAIWNKVKNCSVITTELTDNEKKVLLYSANLQVRGGFAEEETRRKALAEFVRCLQKEPYNLTEKAARKTTKRLVPDKAKILDRDMRIETELDKSLYDLLEKKIITRSECDFYVRFSAEQQQAISRRFEALAAIECFEDEAGVGGTNELTEMRGAIHAAFRNALEETLRISDMDEFEEKFKEACEECDAETKKLMTASREHKSIDANSGVENAIEKERKAAEKKKGETFIQKDVLNISNKISKKLNSRAYKVGLKGVSEETRQQDIQTLDELIGKIRELRNLIAGE